MLALVSEPLCGRVAVPQMDNFLTIAISPINLEADSSLQSFQLQFRECCVIQLEHGLSQHCLVLHMLLVYTRSQA